MKAFAQRLQQVVGTALILAFFSEFYFLNEGPIEGLLQGLEENPIVAIFSFLELPAYYGLFAYPMLIAIGHFRVSTWAGLILAASLYGLAAEALVVPVVYEGVPYSIIWTSLSWHTLIDVVLGWYILRRAMRARSIWPGVVVMLAAGVFWGIWATWFWVEDMDAALTLTAFSSLVITTSTALIIGVILADHAPLTEFKASRVEIIVVALISALLFGLTGLAYFPLPILILGVLLAIFAALKAAQGQESKDMLASIEKPPVWPRYLTLALLPASAIATYAMVLETGFQIAAEDAVLLILTAGAISFVAALMHPFWVRLRATK